MNIVFYFFFFRQVKKNEEKKKEQQRQHSSYYLIFVIIILIIAIIARNFCSDSGFCVRSFVRSFVCSSIPSAHSKVSKSYPILLSHTLGTIASIVIFLSKMIKIGVLFFSLFFVSAEIWKFIESRMRKEKRGKKKNSNQKAQNLKKKRITTSSSLYDLRFISNPIEFFHR